MDDEIVVPLPVAAQRLGLTWHQAWRMALTGELDAHRNQSGHWMVQAASVEKAAKRFAHPRRGGGDGAAAA